MSEGDKEKDKERCRGVDLRSRNEGDCEDRKK